MSFFSKLGQGIRAAFNATGDEFIAGGIQTGRSLIAAGANITPRMPLGIASLYGMGVGAIGGAIMGDNPITGAFGGAAIGGVGALGLSGLGMATQAGLRTFARGGGLADFASNFAGGYLNSIGKGVEAYSKLSAQGAMSAAEIGKSFGYNTFSGMMGNLSTGYAAVADEGIALSLMARNLFK